MLACAFISDRQNPVITNLPTDFTVPTDPGKPTAVVTWNEPTASDNSNQMVTLVSNHQSGDAANPFPIGPTIVTYTATDLYSNMETGQFIVTVTGIYHEVFGVFSVKDNYIKIIASAWEILT